MSECPPGARRPGLFAGEPCPLHLGAAALVAAMAAWPAAARETPAEAPLAPLLFDPPWRVERLFLAEAVPAGAGISVDNPLGDVRLRQGDDEQLEVLAVVQSREGDPERSVVELSGEGGEVRVRVGVEPVAEEERRGDVAEEAWATLDRRRRVDLTLFVPAGRRLEVRTRGSLIEAKGLDNDLDLESVEGDVRAVTAGSVRARAESGSLAVVLRDPEWGADPSLETVSGDIRLELPRGAGARVTATTAGRITTDYSIEIRRPAVAGRGRKVAEARIGDATRAVTLTSEVGDVAILESPLAARGASRSAPRAGLFRQLGVARSSK